MLTANIRERLSTQYCTITWLMECLKNESSLTLKACHLPLFNCVLPTGKTVIKICNCPLCACIFSELSIVKAGLMLAIKGSQLFRITSR